MKNVSLSVAVIDDDNIYRFMLSKAFERSGMPVVFQAENGKLGLEHLANCPEPPAVIILDVEMPVMDGFETARRLKASWSKIGVIAHSTLADPAARDLMMQCGADIFLSKGAGIAELVHTVQRLASRKGQVVWPGTSR